MLRKVVSIVAQRRLVPSPLRNVAGCFALSSRPTLLIGVTIASLFVNTEGASLVYAATRSNEGKAAKPRKSRTSTRKTLPGSKSKQVTTRQGDTPTTTAKPKTKTPKVQKKSQEASTAETAFTTPVRITVKDRQAIPLEHPVASWWGVTKESSTGDPRDRLAGLDNAYPKTGGGGQPGVITEFVVPALGRDTLERVEDPNALSKAKQREVITVGGEHLMIHSNFQNHFPMFGQLTERVPSEILFSATPIDSLDDVTPNRIDVSRPKANAFRSMLLKKKRRHHLGPIRVVDPSAPRVKNELENLGVTPESWHSSGHPAIPLSREITGWKGLQTYIAAMVTAALNRRARAKATRRSRATEYRWAMGDSNTLADIYAYLALVEGLDSGHEFVKGKVLRYFRKPSGEIHYIGSTNVRFLGPWFKAGIDASHDLTFELAGELMPPDQLPSLANRVRWLAQQQRISMGMAVPATPFVGYIGMGAWANEKMRYPRDFSIETTTLRDANRLEVPCVQAGCFRELKRRNEKDPSVDQESKVDKLNAQAAQIIASELFALGRSSVAASKVARQAGGRGIYQPFRDDRGSERGFDFFKWYLDRRFNIYADLAMRNYREDSLALEGLGQIDPFVWDRHHVSGRIDTVRTVIDDFLAAADNYQHGRIGFLQTSRIYEPISERNDRDLMNLLEAVEEDSGPLLEPAPPRRKLTRRKASRRRNRENVVR